MAIIQVSPIEAERLQKVALQWQQQRARQEAARVRVEARKKAEAEAKRAAAEREARLRYDTDCRAEQMSLAAARRQNGGKPSRAERRHARLVAEFCAF